MRELTRARRRRGSIALLSALMISALLFFAGLTIDFGLLLLTKRRLQAATDAAALAAAQNIPSATGIVSTILGLNGFADAKLVSLTTGNYTPDPAIALGSRYVAGQLPLQALHLSTSYVVPMRFIRAIVPHASLTVTATAGGVAIAEAGINAGSGLASINAGVENAILGQALGSQLSLDAASYQGLVNANVTAVDFLNALATEANVTTGTYGQLMSGNMAIGDVLEAELVALNNGTGGSSAAAAAILQIKQQMSSTSSISLTTLLNPGPWSKAPIGKIDPNSMLNATLNVYQLTSFAAQIANGSHLIQAASLTTIPGVATVDVALAAIEPDQSSYYALGPAGITVHTSQVRALLSIKLLNLLPLLVPAPVSLQVYVEVADGTATLQSITCGKSPKTDTVAVVSAVSGLANAYVGNVSPVSVMTDFSKSVTPVPATIVNVAGLSVTGYAQVSTAGNAATLTFSSADIAALTPQTVSNTNITSNILQSLQTKMTLQTSLPLITLTPLLTPLLTPVFAALDGVVDQVLRSLGIRLGYLDVTVNGGRCGVPALMQ